MIDALVFTDNLLVVVIIGFGPAPFPQGLATLLYPFPFTSLFGLSATVFTVRPERKGFSRSKTFSFLSTMTLGAARLYDYAHIAYTDSHTIHWYTRRVSQIHFFSLRVDKKREQTARSFFRAEKPVWTKKEWRKGEDHK